jgi:hypothetical protein
MFKAKVIDGADYYVFRRKQLLLMLLPTLPYAFVVNFFQLPMMLSVFAFVGYVLLIVLHLRNQRKLQSLVGNSFLEASDDRLVLKSNKGAELKVFSVANVDRFIAKEKYVLYQENMKEIASEVKGNPTCNYLVLCVGSERVRFDFEVDSFYMIKQLEKLLDLWKTKGLIVERVV